MKVLNIISTPLNIKQSKSLQLNDYYINKMHKLGHEIYTLDLYNGNENIPYLDKEFMTLWLFKDKNDLSDREQKLWDKKIELAKHFATFDHYVIAAPYWDGLYPSRLKEYLDIVAHPGIAFTYKGGQKGLLKGTFTFIQAIGGPHIEKNNFGLMHIRFILDMFGLKEKSKYIIEKTNIVEYWTDDKIDQYKKAIDKEFD